MKCILVLVAFLLLALTSQAQMLRGLITNENNEPIPYAKIYIENSSYGTYSNTHGKFQLELKKGEHSIVFSASGYQKIVRKAEIYQEDQKLSIQLHPKIQETEEVVIYSNSGKNRGKEIMREVIAKRSHFQDLLKEYNVNTYALSSLEKEEIDDSTASIQKEKMNLIEWQARSFYKHPGRFKDKFYAFQDFQERPDDIRSTSIGISADFDDDRRVQPMNHFNRNPHLFINGIREFHFSLFDNKIEIPMLTETPLISPMAFNAFMYYNFYLDGSFFDENGDYIYKIEVRPVFDYEPLFKGILYIKKEGLELTSYDLSINENVLNFLENIQIICDYKKLGDRLVPVRREFIYTIQEKERQINGFVRLRHSDYQFTLPDRKINFWSEAQTYTDDAFDKDEDFWSENRPLKLKPIEKEFIRTQDSIVDFRGSDRYLRRRDSIRNQIKWYDIFLGGIGHVNSFEGYDFHFPGLVNQVIPFGVGGYRHRLNPTYTQTFKNGNQLMVAPDIDYGFNNRDMRGGIKASFMHNPLTFSRFGFELGDFYEFITPEQNFQGVLAPVNRVRNKKAEINYRRELFNGLYGRGSLHYSDRFSIDNLDYPDWVEVFGMFQEPKPFNQYRIFLATFDFEYHIGQRYMIRKGVKYILDSPYPVLRFKYKKALPQFFGTDANFDYFELRAEDEVDWKNLGYTQWKVLAGAFAQTQDLRIIEHRFFRPSDRFFFSNPLNTLQRLDTMMNTSSTFLQVNYIHHFNGFFLNKIWGINRLKLEETVGGGMLFLPASNFAQIEFYVGLERALKIRKQRFKIGVYAVSRNSNFGVHDVSLKIGINFFNTYNQRWDY